MRLALVPGLLALAAWGVAAIQPQDRIWGHILQASLLSARPWLCLLGALLQVLSLARHRRPAIAGPALLAYLLLSGLPPQAPLPGEAVAAGPGLRVLSANLDAFSDGPPAAGALAARAPDVLLLIERRDETVDGLVRVADNYGVPMERVSHGHAVHCRPELDCQAAITAEIGSETSRMPAGLLRLPVPGPHGDVPACIISLHAPPPAPLNPTGLHPYMDRLRRQVRDGRAHGQWGPCQDGDPVLAIGDFNTVPGTPAFAKALSTGLRDVQAGRGLWRRTWPAGGGWPDLPYFALDHALVSDDLQVRQLRRLPMPGADHLALELLLSSR